LVGLPVFVDTQDIDLSGRVLGVDISDRTYVHKPW
jgi:hypothetical protein